FLRDADRVPARGQGRRPARPLPHAPALVHGGGKSSSALRGAPLGGRGGCVARWPVRLEVLLLPRPDSGRLLSLAIGLARAASALAAADRHRRSALGGGQLVALLALDLGIRLDLPHRE